MEHAFSRMSSASPAVARQAETLTTFVQKRAEHLHSMGKLTQLCTSFLRDACEALCFLHALGWVRGQGRRPRGGRVWESSSGAPT